MKCSEYMLEGLDVSGVLPTGFGKSILFHLLPDFIPVKTTKNIVIVVCPLNAIIEDQLKVLKARRITADVLQLAVDEKEPAENLFGMGSKVFQDNGVVDGIVDGAHCVELW